MTQVRDMTDNELNSSIIKLLGGKVVQSHDAKQGGGAPYYQLVAAGFKGRYERNPEDAWIWCPDFSSDPAASLEVLEKAINADMTACIANLLVAVNYDYNGMTTIEATAAMLTAKPRQRAEAVYMTISQIQGEGGLQGHEQTDL